jgi:transglutaminase-like putative cysteine protease
MNLTPMRYQLRHLTHFAYERPVSFARCNLRLKPIAWEGQTLLSHSLSSEPDGVFTPAPAGNSLVNVTRLVLGGAIYTLDIISNAEIEVFRLVPMIMPDDPTVAQIGAWARASHDVSDMSPANFLFPSPLIAQDGDIGAWCAQWLAPDHSITQAAMDLTWAIQRDFAFDPDATRTETLPAEAFAKRAGVCQDFAQIMISGLRSAGIPAAYASGYIRTIPPPGEERLQGADAMHGWVLVWCGPQRGWIGFDPTNGILMAGDHILVAVGRDYLDIAPIDGIFTGYGAQEIRVDVDVIPIEG